MAKGRQKGTVKTGGRAKGTPNKVTSAIKECISKVLTEYTNSETFLKDFAELEPKERLMIAEKLMNYVVPKMSLSMNVSLSVLACLSLYLSISV